MRLTRPSIAVLTLAGALAAPSAQAQQAAPPGAARVTRDIRAQSIWAPLRFLSDDLLEGRGTGTRGGQLTTAYLASQYMALGLEPAGDSGTYFHHVPVVTLVPDAQLDVTGGAAPASLHYRDDFVAWSERVDTSVSAEGEIVFVGYGITAPQYRWDDFKNTDVRGKIVMMLVNDPGQRDPSLFRGSAAMTYYGRWTYKLEEAARRGAAGVLLVHNDTMATYGWNTVRNSWTGDQVRLEAPPTSLVWAGWIRQPVAAALLRQKGIDLDQLIRQAPNRTFQPVPTGITVRGTVRSTVRRSISDNVVGRLPGADPRLKDEAVLISAHWDHLGIVPNGTGDSIMNGAEDNASGVATMLAIAEAMVESGVKPKRSIMFVAFTGEEKGLLGSQAFALRPPLPLARIAAILNVDVANLWGRTRDMSALGGDQSSLGPMFAAAARAEGLRVRVDSEALQRGAFFRSDHFPLARVGVPGLSFEHGMDYVGHPAGWGEEQQAAYNRDRYHQPGDEILPWYTVDGAIQEAKVMSRVALAVADAPIQPRWSPASEFAEAGRARVGR